MTLFFVCVFDMERYERLWIGVYKRVEVQEVKTMNWNAKSFVCTYEGRKALKQWTKGNNEYLFFNLKSLEILNQMKQEVNV